MYIAVLTFIFWGCVGIILYTHLGYLLLLRLISLFAKKGRQGDETHIPTVSMLISAYNEEKIIAEKIHNFLELDYPAGRIELIIGSDRSDDRTDALIRPHCGERIKLFSFSSRRGKATVLNEIVKHAKGEILVFSDANTMYDSAAIKKLVRHFVDPEIGGVCGLLRLVNPNENMGGKGEQLYWRYENRLKKYEGSIKTVFGANGAIYALRKSLYRKLPERKVIMDDFILPLKAVEQGYDVIYDEEAWAVETTSPDVGGEFRRKIRIGCANFNALTEIKTLLSPRRGFIALGLWSHKIFRWGVPLLLAIAFAANAGLLAQTFYKITLLVQLLFYLSAGMGYITDKTGRTPKPFFYPFYFCTINLGLALGFIKFISGSQKPAWTRVERG